MKIKRTIGLILLLNIVFITNVNAKESFYINQYGVSFSKDEYNFLSDFYFNGYQDYMKSENYSEFIKSNIINTTIKTSIQTEYGNVNMLSLESFHETSSKSLKVSSACSTVCAISIVAEWKKSPTIRSYDVIGAYIKNIKMSISPSTTLYYDSGTITSSYTKNSANGFGTSIKLPNSGGNIKVVQTFITEPSGIIYASYQHAKKNSTLAKSQKYSISRNGYGGVFLFESSVEKYYDGMSGVFLEI